ncbi:MAG TPA: methylenetetrahydrofolate reductase [Actinomycetota bacterium]
MAVRRKRNASGLTPDQRAVLRGLVAHPKFELIPLKNAMEAADALPHAATVTVTASPSHGLESTVELGESLAERGHVVVPHLSAHMIRDRAHLSELLQRCRDAGFTRAFVVGGDAKEPGDFHDGLSLLRAMDELGHPFTEIGVPSYPEGHVDISTERLLEVLKEKQRYAKYMATQMSFNPGAILSWLGQMRANGVMLPVHLGTPGVAELTKLMTISTRIGIADSARYLKKNRRMVGSLLTPGKFGPDALLEGMGPAYTDPGANIEALHLFTFNQVQATVDWQARMLATLDE